MSGSAYPTPRAAVGLIVFDDIQRILLIKRGPNALVGAGEWALPGGKLDAGETIDKSGARELEEETGIIASRLIATPIITEDLFWGPENHFVTHYRIITEWTGIPSVMEPHKHDAIMWLDIPSLKAAKQDHSMKIFAPLCALIEQGSLDVAESIKACR